MHDGMHPSPTAAVVVYQGVLADETDTMRFVLSRLPGLETRLVGQSVGTYAGPGGASTAESSLAGIGNPQIIAIPGGIGAHRCTAIADWLTTVSPAWILTSSTGSALLAAAGLLRDATAATHWLAGSLLEEHGAHPSRERVVVDGRIVTCSGCSSAFRGALVIAEAYGGASLVQQIRADATGASTSAPAGDTIWGRLWDALRPSRRPAQPIESLPPVGSVDEAEVLHLGSYTLHTNRRGAGEE